MSGTFAQSLAVVGLEAAILNEWEHGEETGQSIDHPSAALQRNSTPRATWLTVRVVCTERTVSAS